MFYNDRYDSQGVVTPADTHKRPIEEKKARQTPLHIRSKVNDHVFESSTE